MKATSFYHLSNVNALEVEVEVNEHGNLAASLMTLGADLHFYLNKEQALELMQAFSVALLDADMVGAGVETADDVLVGADVATAKTGWLTQFEAVERDRADAIAALAQKFGDDRRALRCDCGGPAMGTDHAPDCSMVLELDRLVALYDDGLTELGDEFDEKLAKLEADRNRLVVDGAEEHRNDEGDPGHRGLMTEL